MFETWRNYETYYPNMPVFCTNTGNLNITDFRDPFTLTWSKHGCYYKTCKY